MSQGLDTTWRRIAGLETNAQGDLAAVWLAHDRRDTDTVHVYDACLWRSEVMAVIAEGMSARGKRIPVAWPKRADEVVTQLLERGLDTLHEPVSDDPVARGLAAREVLERLRTKRMRVSKRCSEWLAEYRTYYETSEGTPPRDSHPLMAATQAAIMQLDFARAPEKRSRGRQQYPKLPII